MNATELLALYRTTPATEQAKFLTHVLSGFERHAETDYGEGATLDPNQPQCPTCGQEVTTLLDIDTSWTQQEAQIDHEDKDQPRIAAPCAERADFHVSFFLTPCCRAAVRIPLDMPIDFG